MILDKPHHDSASTIYDQEIEIVSESLTTDPIDNDTITIEVLPDHHAESSHAIPPYAQPPTGTSSIIPTSTAISPTFPHETMSVSFSDVKPIYHDTIDTSMGQDLSKMDDQEIKIERVDFVIESDDACYDEYNTDDIPINQLESTSHAGSGKKSAKLATIANMEKTFDEMRKYPQFAY